MQFTNIFSIIKKIIFYSYIDKSPVHDGRISEENLETSEQVLVLKWCSVNVQEKTRYFLTNFSIW